MFGGSSEYTAFHDVGSVHVFLFFIKGIVRELQDSNSVKILRTLAAFVDFLVVLRRFQDTPRGGESTSPLKFNIEPGLCVYEGQGKILFVIENYLET